MINLLRRTLLLGSAAAAMGSLKNSAAKASVQAIDLAAPMRFPYQVPALPYCYSDNEPSIDQLTMTLHHDYHHAAYVANLNALLNSYSDLQQISLRALLQRVTQLPEAIRTGVRNNAGGHANHTMFWQVLGGRGGAPVGNLSSAIDRDFGSFDTLKAGFNKAATSVFGSGWVMVVTDRTGKLPRHEQTRTRL